MCVSLCVHALHRMYMEVRGDLARVGSFLLLCELLGLNQACQALWQAPLRAEPSQQPIIHIVFAYMY